MQCWREKGSAYGKVTNFHESHCRNMGFPVQHRRKKISVPGHDSDPTLVGCTLRKGLEGCHDRAVQAPPPRGLKEPSEVFMHVITMLPIERAATVMYCRTGAILAKARIEAAKACFRYAKEQYEMPRRSAGASGNLAKD